MAQPFTPVSQEVNLHCGTLSRGLPADVHLRLIMLRKASAPPSPNATRRTPAEMIDRFGHCRRAAQAVPVTA